MEILDQNKLVLFIAFILPGFITLKVYALLCPVKKEELNQQLIDALTYSCINYGFHFVFIVWIQKLTQLYDFPFLYGLFYFYLLFIFPVFLGWLWLKIRNTKWLQKNSPHPTPLPWDYIFSNQEVCWMIITLNDGTKIAGRYGDRAFASSYPEEPQIYMSECWVLNLDGGFERKRNRSAGIIVLSKEMQSIEFFED